MISNTEIEKAFDFLRENGQEAGKARADRLFLEQFGKTLKSRLMRESNEKSAAAQEAFALSHPDYETHLKGYQMAVEKDEYLRWQKDRALALIDAWRTQEASHRGTERVG